MADVNLRGAYGEAIHPNAHSIHVIAQGKDGGAMEMPFNVQHPMAILLKNHKNLPELDPVKLKEAGHIDEVAEVTKYYDVDSLNIAIKQNYNHVVNEAARLLAKMTDELHPGDDVSISVRHLDSATDRNEHQYQELIELFEADIREISNNSAMSDSYTDEVKQMEKMQERLKQAGGLVKDFAEFHHKVIAPTEFVVDTGVEKIDFSAFEKGASPQSEGIASRQMKN